MRLRMGHRQIAFTGRCLLAWSVGRWVGWLVSQFVAIQFASLICLTARHVLAFELSRLSHGSEFVATVS